MTVSARTISRRLVDDICDGLDKPCRIRGDYSGRGMYGQCCFGVTPGRGQIVEFPLRLAARLDVEGVPVSQIERLGRGGHTDSMGLDTIVYFPGWNLDQDQN